jgi:enediyne biosynthesis protein E9
MRDLVIIGSGFGGSVMAARLAPALKALGRTVLVLEKGRDHTGAFDPRSEGGNLNAQGNRFKHSFDLSELTKVAELFTDTEGAYRQGTPSMSVIAGNGFGGGSNVYDGVSLRAPTEAFEQVRDLKRLWPRSYSRENLNAAYARAESTLKVHKLAWTDQEVPHWQLATKRDFVFAEGCRRIGAVAAPLKVADEDDANEGWWNQGQRFQGRQDLTKNYLAGAKASGAEFWSGCEVTEVVPAKVGYVVRGVDRRGGVEKTFELECRMLIVASGAVASTGLLLRSSANFTGARSLSTHLGKHVSSNGDYGVTGVVGSKFEFDVQGHKGKPMSSFCPSFFAEHKFILIPFFASPLYLALGQPSTLLRAENPLANGRGSTGPAKTERDWGALYKSRLTSFGSRMLTMGCLALDDSEGEIRVAKNGSTYEVRWGQTSARTEATWSRAVSTMRNIYEALGGEMFLDAYRKDGTVNTAHPLGGCRMGGSVQDGVVSDVGEVHGNRNLFVIDGAMIPSALGVNPSLTIAALAERIAERLIQGQNTDSLGTRM